VRRYGYGSPRHEYRVKQLFLILVLFPACTFQMVGDQTRLDDLTRRVSNLEEMTNQHTQKWNDLERAAAAQQQLMRQRAQPSPTPQPEAPK